jgi:DNA-binding NarL/FixJ family response regulator
MIMNVGMHIAPGAAAAPRPLPAPTEHPDIRSLVALASAPHERELLQRATTEARTALEEAAVAAAVAAQRALSVAEALDEALAVLAAADEPALPATPTPQRPTLQPGLLSRREQEVLALVAEGRSNKSIAEALFVSPNTVKTHVASLLNKLHADTRVQLAAIAARQAWQ